MAPKFVCLILSLWCLEARVAPVAKLFPLEAYFPRGERSRNLLSHEPSGFRPQATSTYTSNSHEYQSQNKPLQSLQVNNSKSSSPGLGTLECTKAGHRWKSRVGTLTQLFTDTQLPRIGVAYTFWEGSMQRVSLHFSTAHARLYWNHSASRTWQLLKVMSQASTVWVEVICRHAGKHPEGQQVSGLSRGGIHSFWSGRRAGVKRGNPVKNEKIMQSSGGEAAVTLCTFKPLARTS